MSKTQETTSKTLVPLLAIYVDTRLKGTQEGAGDMHTQPPVGSLYSGVSAICECQG